jgi:hypothetical protein
MQHRARIAAKRRHHGPDADVADDIRNMRAARAEDYIRSLVASAPPLTPDQTARLRLLLTTR